MSKLMAGFNTILKLITTQRKIGYNVTDRWSSSQAEAVVTTVVKNGLVTLQIKAYVSAISLSATLTARGGKCAVQELMYSKNTEHVPFMVKRNVLKEARVTITPKLGAHAPDAKAVTRLEDNAETLLLIVSRLEEICLELENEYEDA